MPVCAGCVTRSSRDFCNAVASAAFPMVFASASARRKFCTTGVYGGMSSAPGFSVSVKKLSASSSWTGIAVASTSFSSSLEENAAVANGSAKIAAVSVLRASRPVPPCTLLEFFVRFTPFVVVSALFCHLVFRIFADPLFVVLVAVAVAEPIGIDWAGGGGGGTCV